MKKVVFLALGVLSLTLFSFKSGTGGTITVSDEGMYICDNTDFSASDDYALSVITQAHIDDVEAAGFFIYRHKTTTNDKFTETTFIGSALVSHADEFLDAQEMAQVQDIMSHYMDN